MLRGAVCMARVRATSRCADRSCRAAAQSVERKRRRLRPPYRPRCRASRERQRQKRQHCLGAIEQRQTLPSLRAREARSPRRPSPSAPASLSEDGLAFANGDLREMREGREVARRADRALRRNHGLHAAVEHFEQGFRDDRVGRRSSPSRSRSRGARASRARIRSPSGAPTPHAWLRTRLICRWRISSREMRVEAILPNPVLHAVDGSARLDDSLDYGARGVHSLASGRSEPRNSPVENNAIEIFER